MTTKRWIHLVLHVGCVALLLLQGHRIQQLRNQQAEHLASETRVREILWLISHRPGPPWFPVESGMFWDPRCFGLGNPEDIKCGLPTYVDFKKEAIEPPLKPWRRTGAIY
jgi:hypothetical protein